MTADTINNCPRLPLCPLSLLCLKLSIHQHNKSNGVDLKIVNAIFHKLIPRMYI